MRAKSVVEEIRRFKKDIEELKLLQLKLIEYIMPSVKPTKKEESLIRNLSKMKFYPLEEVKRKLKI